MSQFRIAAQIDAQMIVQGKSIGVRPLAKIVSVDPGTITKWRRNSDYHGEVEMYKWVFSEHWLKILIFSLACLRSRPFSPPLILAIFLQVRRGYCGRFHSRNTQNKAYVPIRDYARVWKFADAEARM